MPDETMGETQDRTMDERQDEMMETMRSWRRQYRRWTQTERRRALSPWAALSALGLPEWPREVTTRDEAVAAGWVWERAGRRQAAPEVLAVVEAHAAGTADSDDAPAASAAAVEDRLRFLARARRELACGAELTELLARIEDGPAEALLHHARLLRAEVETLADPPAARAHRLVDETLALWAELPPSPVQARCADLLLALGARRPEVAVHVLSEAVARAVAGSHNARTLRAAEDAVDDVVSAMLRGRRFGESHEAEARRCDECARQLAYVAGALAARHSLGWDDAWRALSDDDALACAFVSGAAMAVDEQAPPPGLIELVRDARPEVSMAAWAARAAATPDVSSAHGLLAAIPREPSEAARMEVASAWRLPASDHALLVALLGDPKAGVRAAAARNLLGRDALGDEELRALRADLTAGSLQLRDAALRALAWAGEASLEDGEALVRAALDEYEEEEAADGEPLICSVACSAAGALAVWAGPEPHWRELYRRATEERSWLRALGLALTAATEEALPMLFPAPPELVEPLRIAALRHLGDDETGYEAATVLAAHPDPAERLFDLLAHRLSAPDLARLALLAPSARRPHPELIEPLWAWIEDEDAEDAVRISALSALGHMAPGEPAVLARLGPLVVDSSIEVADAAYVALARVAARAAQLADRFGR